MGIKSKSERIREEDRLQQNANANKDIHDGQLHDIGKVMNETKNPDISDKFWESNEASSQGNIKHTSKKGVVSTVFSLLYSPVTYVLSTNKESIPTSTVIQENENGDVQARKYCF